jgi:hypothetical protein
VIGAHSTETHHERPGFEELLRAWDGEQAEVRYDAASGARMFVCVHSTQLGPAAGGTRMLVYPTHPGRGLQTQCGSLRR